MYFNRGCAAAVVAACVLAAHGEPQDLPGTRPASLPGFRIEGRFGEQVLTYRWGEDVSVLINAPPPEGFDPGRPTRLVLYALPNGNTIGQTIGRRLGPGVDWHFGIQHIGAQTRYLREFLREENLVVAYLENDLKSWPAWKTKHAPYAEPIRRIVESVQERLGVPAAAIELTAHSGGGGFVFGYIEGAEAIPDRVRRIAFLDANYGFADALRHGERLVEWLRRGRDHVLVVLAYDDRNITVDGKLVVGPDGGTYRKTLRMIERIGRDIPLTGTTAGELKRWRGLEGRVDVIIHTNPQNRILHTALVGQMNGFIHCLSVGSRHENTVARFGAPVAYERWIAPE